MGEEEEEEEEEDGRRDGVSRLDDGKSLFSCAKAALMYEVSSSSTQKSSVNHVPKPGGVTTEAWNPSAVERAAGIIVTLFMNRLLRTKQKLFGFVLMYKVK